MKNSFKQLFRTPAKTTLFFLLMAAATLLLVLSSSLLSETSQRIDEVENSFTTLARVEQVPALADVPMSWYNECWGTMIGTEDIYDERISAAALNAEGLDYVNPPEYRPYYLLEHSDWKHSVSFQWFREIMYNIIEFTPVEEMDEFGAAHCRVEEILHKQSYTEMVDPNASPTVGQEILICQCSGTGHDPHGTMIQLIPGKRYIATIRGSYDSRSHPPVGSVWLWYNIEHTLVPSPYSSQCGTDGEPIPSEHFPYLASDEQNRYRIEEVTEDFYDEGGRGQDWLEWAKLIDQREKYFTVMPTSSLQMLPVFQEHGAYLADGREITEEEFESGALVCIVPEDMLAGNRWQIGDKLRLPLQMSLYGPNAAITNHYMGPLLPSVSYFTLDFSPLRADGKPYDVFWDEEYEIVGTYSLVNRGDTYNNGEIYPDTILIPKNSVQASDEDNIAGYNYMDGKTATFQIPNGTIDEFDAALRSAVPEAESLLITYNDNGYTEIMESLQSTRTAALLLFVVGLLAAVVIVLLLLYFFIVRERKRTAIERSLGMSKRACRVSLLAGVFAITVLATGLGTAGGAAAMSLFHGQNNAIQAEVQENDGTVETVDTAAQADTIENYNPKYSLWARADRARQELTEDYSSPACLYFTIPLTLVVFVLLLSFLLVEQNLKIEPIYLLSGKME